MFELWTCQLRKAGKHGVPQLLDEFACEITNPCGDGPKVSPLNK